METSADPLAQLIGRIRRPAAYRHIIASCLRSIYMGDPFSKDEGGGGLPPLPRELFEDVSCTEVSAPDGTHCVVYRPTKVLNPGTLILYTHGGGFVVGCSEDMDYTTRVLCRDNDAIVVSVNYVLAPESPFPTALNQCVSVVRWLLSEPGLGGNCESLYLCGDSAGGNLALTIGSELSCLGHAPRGIVALAPWLDMAVENYESFNRLAADGIVFDAPFIAYARACYAPPGEWRNPLVSPLHLDYATMPPCLIAIGTNDPLVDQVRALQSALSADGDASRLAGGEGNAAARNADVHFSYHPDVPHAFYALPGLYDQERRCFEEISRFIELYSAKSRR